MSDNIFEAVDDIDDIDEPTQTAAALPAIAAPARSFELTELEHDLANTLDLSLEGDARKLVGIATAATNQALTLVIESGLLLMAAHGQLAVAERSATGQFTKNEGFRALLDEFGLPHQRAYEAMGMAKYVANLPIERRGDMLALPKTKVMLLAQADPEVIADLFEDEGMDIEALTVRELKNQIRELKAGKAQDGVAMQRAEATARKLEQRLIEATQTRADITDIVPPHVSDIRIECAVLFKKAELSVDGIARLIGEVHLLDGEWSVSAARSTFAALDSIIKQAKGAAAMLHKAYGAELDGDNNTMERLTQKELFKCATEYKALIGEHEHEAALREYERGLDKPKGKGRPKAAPTMD